MGKMEKHMDPGEQTESGDGGEPERMESAEGTEQTAPPEGGELERDEEQHEAGRSPESLETSPQADGVPEDEGIGR